MENVECGAAALGSILAYYKRFVTLDQLRTDCGISRDGCKASNLILAAKKHGLTAAGYELTVDELDELTLPFIAFWHFNHFIVVEWFDEDNVYINDPSIGHRIISKKKFSEEYSNEIFQLAVL